jgi:formate/nitrite transporter
MNTTKNPITCFCQQENLLLAPTLIRSFLAGIYISLGTIMSLLVSSSMSNGVLYSGIVFSFGLGFILITSSLLFTGDVLRFILVLTKQIKLKTFLKRLGLVYIGNIIGSISTAIIISASNLINKHSEFRYYINTFASSRVNQTPLVSLVSGIGCCFLVALAVFLVKTNINTLTKIFAVIIPIWVFVSLGFQHSIANFFLLPLDILLDNAGYDVFKMITNNLLFVSIGNLIGGLILASLMYFAYKPEEPAAS